ncbi:MAG: hypothetical protein GEU28_05780 [Dehalococcoidia bacterium]|nr:hypothetical protein [Dehalococcoidia bacterium]
MKWLGGLALMSLALVVSCGEDNDEPTGGATSGEATAQAGEDEQGADGASARVTVVATTTHLADFARNVGGDRVEVVGLLDPGVDPHDYEFRPSDAEVVAGADLVFMAGLELDGWMTEVIENAGGSAHVVDTSEGLHSVELLDEQDHEGEHADGEDEHSEDADHAAEDEHEADDHNGDNDDHEGDDHHGHDHEGGDPHVWFDPQNVLTILDNVAAGLAVVDPDGEEAYRAGYDTYAAEVREMDDEVEEIFSRCAPGELKLVTTHHAFTHLAHRYGIEIIGAVIPSVETTAEPSAGELAGLIELIRDEDVPAIFTEAGLSVEVEEQASCCRWPPRPALSWSTTRFTPTPWGRRGLAPRPMLA